VCLAPSTFRISGLRCAQQSLQFGFAWLPVVERVVQPPPTLNHLAFIALAVPEAAKRLVAFSRMFLEEKRDHLSYYAQSSPIAPDLLVVETALAEILLVLEVFTTGAAAAGTFGAAVITASGQPKEAAGRRCARQDVDVGLLGRRAGSQCCYLVRWRQQQKIAQAGGRLHGGAGRRKQKC
jgi:hypothetical protein